MNTLLKSLLFIASTLNTIEQCKWTVEKI